MPLEDIPFCEIYYPTMNEFQNFYNYVEKLSMINKTGIVKVIISKIMILFNKIKYINKKYKFYF